MVSHPFQFLYFSPFSWAWRLGCSSAVKQLESSLSTSLNEVICAWWLSVRQWSWGLSLLRRDKWFISAHPLRNVSLYTLQKTRVKWALFSSRSIFMIAVWAKIGRTMRVPVFSDVILSALGTNTWLKQCQYDMWLFGLWVFVLKFWFETSPVCMRNKSKSRNQSFILFNVH